MPAVGTLAAQDARQERRPRPVGDVIQEAELSGVLMLKMLREEPLFTLGRAAVDFSKDSWRVDARDAIDPDRTQLFTFGEGEHKESLKLYCLLLLARAKDKPHSIHTVISRLERDVEALGFPAWTSPSPAETRRRFDKLELGLGKHTLRQRKNALRGYLLFLQVYFKVAVHPDVFDFLDECDREALAQEKEAGKHQEVPGDYLEALVSACQEYMRDDACPPRLRITAAATLLYSQIGMRARELLTMTADALEFDTGRSGDLPPIPYLVFRSPKSAPPGQPYKICRCIANEASLEAYRFLLGFCREKREALGTDALIAVPGQRGKYCSYSSMRTKYVAMIAAMRDRLPSTGVHNLRPDLRFVIMGANYRRSGFEEYAHPETPLQDGDAIIYPTFHQFRVSVCTWLYRHGVELDYIREHMNHLTEDMTAYYNRAGAEVEEEYSAVVYDCVLNGGSKLLGPRAREFTEQVSAFIESNSANVVPSNEEVAKLAARAFPLRRKLGGVCVACGQFRPCPESQPTDELLCVFRLCPNHCHLYFTAAETYDCVRDAAEIVRINEERGHARAVENEVRKLQNVIRGSLMPELEELERELERQGRDAIIKRFPALAEVADNLASIKEEAEQWLSRQR